MKILAIETSCDETALCIVNAESPSADRRSFFHDAKFEILGESLLSQINLHREFGGVYPTLAKREHAINLTPMLQKVLKEAEMYNKNFKRTLTDKDRKEIEENLSKESALSEMIIPFLNSQEKPEIDKIAVTTGPGLEPALWVGINFAKTLSSVWNIPIIPVNHMEGHIFSGLLSKQEDKERKIFKLKNVEFPAISLLISGGHTEIVLMKDWGEYKIIGETRDDAAGEAFDKVARMLDLPYPGGPEISALSKIAKKEGLGGENIDLPRPMLNSENLNFSFSGLKTAVLYKLKNTEEVSEKTKKEIALDFERAVSEVLVEKTKKAIEETGAKTIIVGGGVSANKKIRKSLNKMVERFEDKKIFFPEKDLAMDNSIMIAGTGYFNQENTKTNTENIEAEGNLRISKTNTWT